jgi:hypothetical protein
MDDYLPEAGLRRDGSKEYYPFPDNPLVESESGLSAETLAVLEEIEEGVQEFPRMSPLGGMEEQRASGVYRTAASRGRSNLNVHSAFAFRD